MKFFKPEDFREMLHNATYPIVQMEKAAEAANKILEERGVVVYGHLRHDEIFRRWYETKDKLDCDTQKALLINIEEIPKAKICDHAAGQITVYQGVRWVESTCLNCGIKLKPGSWVEA